MTHTNIIRTIDEADRRARGERPRPLQLQDWVYKFEAQDNDENVQYDTMFLFLFSNQWNVLKPLIFMMII